MAWDGGAVLRRDRLSHCFTWNLDIISASLLLRHFAHVPCDSLRRLLEEFLHDFYMKVDTNPEVASLLALKIWISTSPLHLTVACPGYVSWLLNEFHGIFFVTVNSNS